MSGPRPSPRGGRAPFPNRGWWSNLYLSVFCHFNQVLAEDIVSCYKVTGFKIEIRAAVRPTSLVPRAFPLKVPHLQGKSPGNEVVRPTWKEILESTWNGITTDLSSMHNFLKNMIKTEKKRVGIHEGVLNLRKNSVLFLFLRMSASDCREHVLVSVVKVYHENHRSDYTKRFTNSSPWT